MRSLHEHICRWIDKHYISQQQENEDMVIISSEPGCCNLTALSYIPDHFPLSEEIVYAGFEEVPCTAVSRYVNYSKDFPEHRTGALRFTFVRADDPSQKAFEVLQVSEWYNPDDPFKVGMMILAAMPRQYVENWLVFAKECERLNKSALPYKGEVYIFGGSEASFDATVNMEDIVLPPELKENLMTDIIAFFEKGVEIYDRLHINPFRKLLLAGVPGTGKTMLCSAIAKWALERDFFVVYVSGANRHGAQFWKIHHALDMAASADSQAIIIVEEFDAYLDDDSKAELLNVLDGSETPVNPKGTLMLATTNHPEDIDDRVMRRPGRLDRIYIIPEMESEEDAEKMLRKYLADDFREEHREVIPDLVGKSGAFIREVALQALTIAAYENVDGLPLDILESSIKTLTEQIEAKDDFLTKHKRRPMGLLAGSRMNGNRRRRRASSFGFGDDLFN